MLMARKKKLYGDCPIVDALLFRAKKCTATSISPVPSRQAELEPFIRVLELVPGLLVEDQRRYAALFVQDKIRGTEQLGKMDAAALKALGIPMGDAVEILETVKKLSASKLFEQYSSSSLGSSFSSRSDDDAPFPELEEGMTYVAFASHNWGSAESNFMNHKRAGLIVDKLKSLGINIWFDHDRLTGAIEGQITKGIDDSATFLVFITKDYIDKVISGSDSEKTEWCHYEFMYAGQQKPNKMIAIVMEPDMLDVQKWRGPVGGRLGGKIFVDFTADDKLDVASADLCRMMATML